MSTDGQRRNIAENFNRLRVHERYRRQTGDDIMLTWTWVHVR